MLGKAMKAISRIYFFSYEVDQKNVFV